MNNTKVKNKILLGIFLLLLVATCAIAGIFATQPTYAQSAAGSVSGLTENEYVFTNTDTPNGSCAIFLSDMPESSYAAVCKKGKQDRR